MITVYDKTKYHVESPEFPDDAPELQAGVHIAFFLRWMIEKGFLDPSWRRDFADDLNAFEQHRISASELLDIVGGVLSDDMLDVAGKRFADAYYYDYQGAYDDLFRTPNVSIFETKDTDENYGRARTLIDFAYEKCRRA